jgi:uncharacterized protein YjiS (DUF1127 family)
MSARTITHDHPWPYRTTRDLASPGLWARSREGLARAAAAVSRWRRLRRDAGRLMALDDRLLRDIGLSRGEVERAVRGGRARPARPDAGPAKPEPTGAGRG